MRYLGIETFNPSEVTYPQEVKKVLIVNNAVPQPPDSGYEYLLLGSIQDTCRANADSALVYACRSLGTAIFETDFFQDVLLYHDNTRTDNAFLEDRKLTQEQVQALCDETGADAVISFDRLLFDMVKTITNVSDIYMLGFIDVKVKGVVRSYLPSRETPQASVLIEDSVYWAEEAGDLRVMQAILPTADMALRAAGEYIGSKMYSMFVPHWARENRWYYTGFGTQWKKATAYASSENWENAFQVWHSIHQNSSGWKTRAKTASNIALYYELSGDIAKALEWAEKAYDLYKNNAGDEEEHTKLQGAYRAIILDRVRDDRKLNLQFGEEKSNN